eukprot:scaffold38024_cov17-Tisochrysis_lutea.AAC.2
MVQELTGVGPMPVCRMTRCHGCADGTFKAASDFRGKEETSEPRSMGLKALIHADIHTTRYYNTSNPVGAEQCVILDIISICVARSNSEANHLWLVHDAAGMPRLAFIHWYGCSVAPHKVQALNNSYGWGWVQRVWQRGKEGQRGKSKACLSYFEPL